MRALTYHCPAARASQSSAHDHMKGRQPLQVIPTFPDIFFLFQFVNPLKKINHPSDPDSSVTQSSFR